MMTSTLNDRRYSAEICRKRGWTVGTKLIGNKFGELTVIEITAIGDREILAKRISDNGQPDFDSESMWNFSYRDWYVFEENK